MLYLVLDTAQLSRNTNPVVCRWLVSGYDEIKSLSREDGDSVDIKGCHWCTIHCNHFQLMIINGDYKRAGVTCGSYDPGAVSKA